MAAGHIGPRVYWATFAALMVLLVATVAAAHFPLGQWSVIVALTIAVVKVVLIGVYFMHLRYAHPLVVLFSGSGVLWLGILFAYTLSDYYTRQRVEPGVVTHVLAEP